MPRPVAIVTGGGRGIGRAIAVRFLRAGVIVVVADLDTVESDRGRRTNKGDADYVSYVSVDVSVPAEVDHLVSDTLERFGRVDVLVNNAAVSRREAFLDTKLETWNRTMSVNLTGPFLCGQAVAKAMISTHTQGRIVNVASVNAFAAERGCASYVASKGGLLALTRAMAVDLAPYGISVNAVAPGPVRTETTAALFAEDPVMTAIKKGIPQGRPGRPEEVADLVFFLASKHAGFINVTAVTIDGGFTAYLRLD